MTTATVPTLLVVPVFYTFFDDIRVTFTRLLRRALPQQPVAPAATVGDSTSVS